MERNPNEGQNAGTSGAGIGGSSSGTSGFGASSGTGAGSSGYGASGSGAGSSGSVGGESYGSVGSSSGGMGGGSYGSTGTAESKVQEGKDAVRDKLSQGKEAASEKLGKAKEKAGELKASLADKLEAGAEKLRQRNQSASYAGSTGSGSAAIASDDRMAEVSNRVAGGLQASADWIREADLDSMRTGIETQVKEHPGRTLLIAAGLGYLLGKAFRR